MARRKRWPLLVVGAVVVAVAAVGGYAVASGLTPGSSENSASGEATGATSSPAAPSGTRSVPAAESTTPVTPLTGAPVAGAGLEPGPAFPVATDPPMPTGGGDVEVTITSSGWDAGAAAVEVSGFVAGVVENGGVCTLSLTRAQTTVASQRTAEADASTTTCGSLSVPGGQLSPGTWQATLAYRSGTSAGRSAAVTVTVPSS